MIDMGLSRGAKVLWKDDLLFDYTIKVEHQEFKVHKVVLAAVSDYFHAMLTGSMQESQTDSVQLKGLSAEAVSDLIELIYTGDENIVNENGIDILHCAVYLQVPAAVEVCKTRLLNILNEKNCLHVLSTFLACSFKGEAEKVRKFVQANWTSAFEHYKEAEISLEMFQFLISEWEGSEWDLFTLIKEWHETGNENRKAGVNDLMTLVRFCLMTRQETADVKEMDIYLESDGLWRELVDKALEYHDLPVHLKVLNQSEQSTVRADVSPLVITAENVEGKKLLFSLDSNNCWRKHVSKLEGSDDFTRFGPLKNVNNFLIISNDVGRHDLKWHIFDPRTLIWTEMPGMSRQKTSFPLLYHSECLYALGGYNMDQNENQPGYSDELECYSFRNNTWSVIGRIPVMVADHSAFILGDYIYSCGGYEIDDHDYVPSERLDRFNLCTLEWESRAPLLRARRPGSDHEMSVMKICNEESIVILDLEQNTLEVYNPTTNTWSEMTTFESLINDLQPRWDVNGPSRTLLNGNTIFFLSVFSHQDYSSNHNDPDVQIDPINGKKYICMKWVLPENGGEVSVVQFGHIPVPVIWMLRHLRTALLAIPSHIFL